MPDFLSIDNICNRGPLGIKRFIYTDCENVDSILFDEYDRVVAVLEASGSSWYEAEFKYDTAFFTETGSRKGGWMQVKQELKFSEDDLDNNLSRALNSLGHCCCIHVIVELLDNRYFYIGINHWPDKGNYYESALSVLKGFRGQYSQATGHDAQVTIEATARNIAPEYIGNFDDLTIITNPPNPPTPDLTAPALVASTPPDDTTGISINTDLKLYYNEPVKKGGVGGTITLVETGVGNVQVWNVDNAAEVTYDPNTQSICLLNPPTLSYSTAYHFLASANGITDAAGNGWPGIVPDTTLNFNTEGPPDVTPPTLTPTTPADNTVGVDITTLSFVIAADENIEPGIGSFILYDSLGAVIASFDINDATKASISGAVLTLTVPSQILLGGKDYYFLAGPTVIKDISGNYWPGFSAITDWNFTTVDTAVEPTASPVIALSSGTAMYPGNDITMTPGYSDGNGDAEGASTLDHRYYDSEAAALADTDGTAGTSYNTSALSYTMDTVQEGKWLRSWYKPISTVAPTDGVNTGSNVLGPVAVAIANYTHTVTSHTLIVRFANSSDYAIYWGDGTGEERAGTNVDETISKSYPAGSYNVRIYGTSPDFYVFDLDFEEVQSVDMSSANYLFDFSIDSSATLTSVINPTAYAGDGWQFYRVWNCDALTTLNFSNQLLSPAENCEFRVGENANLGTPDFTGTTGNVRYFLCRSNNWLSFTWPSGIGLSTIYTDTLVWLYTNPNLANLNIVNMAGNCNTLSVYNCDISGSIFFGNLVCYSANIAFNGNNITGWDQGNLTGTLSSWYFDDNALSGGLVISLDFTTSITNTIRFDTNTASNFSVDIQSTTGTILTLAGFDSNVQGLVDASSFLFYNADITFYDCPNLTDLSMDNAAAGSIASFNINDCPSWTGGAVDFGINTIKGTIGAENTPVTNLLLGNTNVAGFIDNLAANDANITGILDLGPNTLGTATAGLKFEVARNPLLTNVDLSGCDGKIGIFSIEDCDCTVIDFTGTGDGDIQFTNFGIIDPQVSLQGNSSLDTLTIAPLTTGSFDFLAISECLWNPSGTAGNVLGGISINADGDISATNNAMTEAQVDLFFADLLGRVATSGATGGVSVSGSNAAPSATGAADAATIAGYGYTVTHN